MTKNNSNSIWSFNYFGGGSIGATAFVIMLMLCLTRANKYNQFKSFNKSFENAINHLIKKFSSTKQSDKLGFYKNPTPQIIHKNLNNIDYNTRVIIVGDVHGCYDELKLLLNKCQFKKDVDFLVFVGDLVNKGPKSANVVKYVRELNASCVRGNHDGEFNRSIYIYIHMCIL